MAVSGRHIRSIGIYLHGMLCYWQIGQSVNHLTIYLYPYRSSMKLTISVYPGSANMNADHEMSDEC